MLAALLVHAFIDGNYASSQKPAIDLAAVELVKDPAPAGFHLTLAAGAAAEILYRHVYQASVSYKPAERLTLEGGIYPSHIGFESFFTKDNWNYTRGWLAELSPYFQTGVRGTYRFSKRWSGELHVLNGWQLVNDNDHAKATGAKIAYSGSRVSASFSTFDGPDAHHWRHFGDLVAVWKATPKLSVAGALDRGRQQCTNWLGIAAYSRYAIDDRHAIAFRAERFRDPGLRVSVEQKLNEATLTYELRPRSNLILKFEGRRERSSSLVVAGAVATF